MARTPRSSVTTRHRATPDFWEAYDRLPARIKRLADKNFRFLKQNPQHPSLHFKPVGDYWSVRIGRDHRALAVPRDDGFVWFFIGTHAEYDRMLD